MPAPAHYVRLGRSIEGPYPPQEVQRRLALGLLSTLHEVSTDRVNWRPLGGEPDPLDSDADAIGPLEKADLDALEGLAANAGVTRREAASRPPDAAATSFARATAAAAAGLLAATGTVLLADAITRDAGAWAAAAAGGWIVAGVVSAGGVTVASAHRRRRLAFITAGFAGVSSLGLAAARPHVLAALPLLAGLAGCAGPRIRAYFQRERGGPNAPAAAGLAELADSADPADPADPVGAAVLFAAGFVTLAALALAPGTTLAHAAGYLPALVLAVLVAAIARSRPTVPLVPPAAAAAAALVGAAQLRASADTLTAMVGAAVGLSAAAALLLAARLEGLPPSEPESEPESKSESGSTTANPDSDPHPGSPAHPHPQPSLPA